MANIFKGIESFLGKGAKATSEEIGGFINKTLKGANKAIEELSSSEGLISKEIEAFQKDFREGIVNGADNAGDLAKEFFENNDYSEQIKKFSDMSDDITKLKNKVSDITQKAGAGNLSEEELGKLKDQADIFQEQISKLTSNQQTFLDNITAGATKDYSTSLANNMDKQISKSFNDYDENFINELTRRNKRANNILNKNDTINIPSSMSAEDAAMYSSAQDIFNSSQSAIKDAVRTPGGAEDIRKFTTMRNNAEDLMRKLEQKAGYSNVAANLSSAGNTMSSELADKMDGIIRHAVPIAVGGGLVFSMFNRGGNMSNSELYGQQQPYSN